MTLRKYVRSPQEVLFRLRQESANLRLAAAPPCAECDAPSPLPDLPDPAAVIKAIEGTSFAERIISLARRVLRHEFPLLGIELRTGPEIEWRRDYVSGKSSPPSYFRRLPYLDFEAVGDHKVIWELNRHQHLVLLAQAFRLTGEREFLDEIVVQLRGWLEQNPFQRGINWASALEVAFRALSWTWVWHLAGAGFDPAFRRVFLNALYRHGRHLEYNLSVYFSPNTHLLGEAVALHALGTLFPQFPRARKWRELGARAVRGELDHQVLPDGVHFELSSYYHVYALDFFLLHYLLAGRPPEFAAPLRRMAEWLDGLLGESRSIPFIGDDDGGRLFHPCGSRPQFGCATLATCAALFSRPAWLRHPADLLEQALWWLGPAALETQPALPPPRASRLFSASGFCVMAAGPVRVIVNASPFFSECTGHRHADALSLVVRDRDEDILADAGSFTYVADPALRKWFRGTAAHNTVAVDGLDQAAHAGPFNWNPKPLVEVAEWKSTSEHDYLDASCAYRGLCHRRRVLFLKPDVLLVLDEVAGPEGEHTVEQFWHTARHELALVGADSVESASAWRSLALGTREPWPVVRAVRCGSLPIRLAAAMVLTGGAHPALSVTESGDALTLVLKGPRTVTAVFRRAGPAEIY